MKKNKAISRSSIISGFICLAYIILCLFLELEYHLEFIFIILLINYLYAKLYPYDSIEIAYQQLESLIPLINDLDIKKKLPNTRGYAASPDYLLKINEIIKEKKPNLILEAGSGVSTLVASYALKKYGGGKIISLDHNEKYAQQTKCELKKHNLENYAEVIYAPLKKHIFPISDLYSNYLVWYDTEAIISQIDSIDLFIIDGPPIKGVKNARFPAFPIMFDKMKNGTIIILDDAKRKNEQETIRLWKKEYDCFEYEYIDNEKGLSIIKKTSK